LNTLVGQLAAASARELVGVPFAHCGRTLGGLDCVGVVLAAYARVGAEIPDYRGYSRQAALNDPQAMLRPILEHFEPTTRAHMKPGDLLLFEIRGVMTHVGVYVGSNEFVHAYEGGLRKVVLERLTPQWRSRLKGAFTLK
jgi:cell wall-associated NlpC family hydrolase